MRISGSRRAVAFSLALLLVPTILVTLVPLGAAAPRRRTPASVSLIYYSARRKQPLGLSEDR